MPLELIADRPGHALLQAYEEPPLEPNQVRVRSLFSAVKHGTELRGFRADTSDASDRWDGELRLHRRGEVAGDSFPRRLGNLCLGVVVEVGDAVGTLKVDDRVFAPPAHPGNSHGCGEPVADRTRRRLSPGADVLGSHRLRSRRRS